MEIQPRLADSQKAAAAPVEIIDAEETVDQIKARFRLNRAEAERDTAVERLRVHIERLPLVCLTQGADLRVTDWNPAAEQVFGFRRVEMLGKLPFDLLVRPEARGSVEDLLRQIKRGEMVDASVQENRTKDGRTIVCQWFHTPLKDAHGNFAGMISLGQDITEQRRLQGQFLQAQKMEAIGRLAGGVAHDFNNLLMVINGYSQMVMDSLERDNPARELLAEIGAAGERAAGLTRQLLAFSRRQVIAPQVIDLNALVRDLEKMLRRLIGEDIVLASALKPNLHNVRADPGQMEQVLMNLAVNARDAMPRGGKLTIETDEVKLDESYAKLNPDVRPGPYVLLAVSDTGHGMTPEVKAHLFEPFFTTKEAGRGTGLGLATVYGIVKQSRGHIQAYSEPGLGTTFKVYLPQVKQPARPSQIASRTSPPPRGNETILLVEDEDAVRTITRRILQAAGYTVWEARHGEEAHRVVEQHRETIHLLISDVVMPGIGGRELAEQLLKRHPEMKVLYLSGYTDDAVVRHGILQESVNFLQKPFTASLLMNKIRDVLDVRS